MDLTANARVIFDKRYSIKDADGSPTEMPEHSARRVAENVSSVNALYGNAMTTYPDADPEQFPYRTAVRQYRHLAMEGEVAFQRLDWDHAARMADLYFDMLDRKDFFPNSPTWTGAGTPLGQLAACFVLPIDDDLGRSRTSIYEILKVAVLIQQTGGGNGFSGARLRPNGTLVKRSMGKATGPVGFLKSYDAAFQIIAQGGSRRGANMWVLPIWHPDVLEFINAKTVEGEIEGFNISVALTDDFMQQVKKGAAFDLHWGDKIYDTVEATDLFDRLTSDAWKLGDPGCLFIDRANRDNPVPARYTLEATNPCGEQWLGPFENCCLGSINLSNFAEPAIGPDPEGKGRSAFFDWEGLRKATILSTQFLDDVVDANQYVDEVPELESAAQGGRRIGLGYMGLADAMLKLGVRYGAEDGEAFAASVTEWMRYWSMHASIQRAEERGPFPWIEGSIYDPELLTNEGPGATVIVDCQCKGGTCDEHDRIDITLWSPPEPAINFFDRPRLDWGKIVNGIKRYGIRNMCQTTVAPTGTISNVAGLEGSGCEPVFALVYTRTVMQEGENIVLHYLSPLFQEALTRAGVPQSEFDAIIERVRANKGSCQGVEGVPPEVQHVFVVAADITPTEHVRMQAAIQTYIDNSISKTINMPNNATVADVASVYRLAYDLGCKGITIYRQGSREKEVLSTGKIADDTDVQITEDVWPIIHPLPIPDYAVDEGLDAKIFPVTTPFGKVQVYISEHRDHPGRPFDIRLQLGKAGNDKTPDVEALGRILSLSTRAGVSVEEIVDQLEGIGGQTQVGFGPRRVRSTADGIGKLLRRLYMTSDAETVTLEPADKVIVQAINAGDMETAKSIMATRDAEICPECLMATMVSQAGCFSCAVNLGGCGYEKCD